MNEVFRASKKIDILLNCFLLSRFAILFPTAIIHSKQHFDGIRIPEFYNGENGIDKHCLDECWTNINIPFICEVWILSVQIQKSKESLACVGIRKQKQHCCI